MKPNTIQRKLQARKREIDAAFDKHRGRNSAMSSCITCNHYWGQLRSIDYALELMKKRPNVESISAPDDQ